MATGRIPGTAGSPLTAKGDLFGYSTTAARVPVGSDGSILVADSSQSTGLRYNPIPDLANPVINGGFDIWQRGTSVAFSNSSTNYGADRWMAVSSTTGTMSRQATGDTTNLPNIQYCARVQRTNGQTGVGDLIIYNPFETVNSIPLTGKRVTLSFYARAGSNFSSASNALTYQLVYGTGTDQNPYSYTGATATLNSSVTLTTTWQRFAFDAVVNTASTELYIAFRYTPSGTAGVNDYFEITGVQIDLGAYTATTAPAFRRSGGTIQGELAACQRYYWRWTAGGTYRFTGAGGAYTTTQASIYIAYPVTMRTGATALDTSGMTCHLLKNDSYNGSGSFALANQQESNTQVIYTHGSGIFAAGDFVNLSNGATSTGYIGFTAEL